MCIRDSRSSDRNCDLTADLKRSCITLSVSVTDKLPVAVFEIKDQRRVFKTDISGWNSGRNPEYSY